LYNKRFLKKDEISLFLQVRSERVKTDESNLKKKYKDNKNKLSKSKSPINTIPHSKEFKELKKSRRAAVEANIGLFNAQQQQKQPQKQPHQPQKQHPKEKNLRR